MKTLLLAVGVLLIAANGFSQELKFIEVVHYDHGHRFVQRVRVDDSAVLGVKKPSDIPAIAEAYVSHMRDMKSAPQPPSEAVLRAVPFPPPRGLFRAANLDSIYARQMMATQMQDEGVRIAAVQTTTHDEWMRRWRPEEWAAKQTNAAPAVVLGTNVLARIR